MQNDFPLTLNHIRGRLRSCNRGREVVTLKTADGEVARASHAELSDAIDRSPACCGGSASSRATASATFAWNNQRHFELYFAIPCIGAVLHTLNIRLFEEQLTYIVNHAEDRVIFVDDSLVPMLEKLAPSFELRRALRA